jgi:hypothetical protein
MGNMRKEEEIRKHLDYYFLILKNAQIEHVPKSFVPAAFNYSFSGMQKGLASILREYGIYHISTPFQYIHKNAPLDDNLFGVEAGIMVVDRGEDLLEWDIIGVEPYGQIDGPICGMHWPNILHTDSGQNERIVNAWVELIKPYDLRFDRMLSRDTESCWNQLAYHSCVDITQRKKTITFNFERLRKLNIETLLNTFTVKIKAEKNYFFKSEDLEIIQVEDVVDFDYKILTLSVLKEKREAVLFCVPR